METASDSDSSLRFVPEMLVDYINQRNRNELEPASFFVHGVCLLVDISGFTKLSGDYCEQGKSGIDSLQLATNGFMERLVEVIYSFGGDIIKFAGDAIICVFSADFISNIGAKILRRSICGFDSFKINFDDLSTKGFEPEAGFNLVKTGNVSADVILRVMQCAHQLRGVQTDKLTVHVAMSCGEMCFGILGGFENRWECLISGPCIHQLSGCLDDAPSKHAVMSAECVEVLVSANTENAVPFAETKGGPANNLVSEMETTAGKYTYDILSLESGNYRINEVQCTSTAVATTPKASGKNKSRTQPHLKLIQQFVPVPIAEELESAKELNLMAEIREVTTMFLKWDSYDSTGNHRDLISLQPCFFEAQHILQTTGAYLRQFLVDDKGCVLIACWGMPHLSYLDNAQRGLSAAVQIRQELYKLGMKCSFGITTGDVYCGTVGSALRMEYAAIGSVVNMSARLMSNANGGILIDEATFKHLKLSARAILNSIDPIKVKGRADPLKVYKYNGSGSLTQTEDAIGDHQISFECHLHLSSLVQRLSGAATTPRRNSAVLVPTGRSARSWLQWLNTRSSSKAAGTTMPIYLLHGKPGSGRTTACSWLKSQAAEFSLPVCAVRLNKKDTQDDFIVWRKIFLQLMPKDLFSSNTVQRNYVHNLLRRVYGNSSRSARTQGYPVLRAVLGITCEFADDTVSPSNGSGDSLSLGSITSLKQYLSIKSKPSGSYKPQPVQVLDTLVRIFTHLLSIQATLLIVENIELADAESLRLLVEMTKVASRCAVVCTALAEDCFSNPDLFLSRKNTILSKFNDSREYKTNAFHSTPWSKHYKDLLLGHKATTVLLLEKYKPEEIDKMLCDVLGVRAVPMEVSQIVQDYSGGSYFWVREILQFLKEHGRESFMDALGENENNSEKKSPARIGDRPGTGALLRAPSTRMLSRAQSFRQPSQRRLDVSSPHQQQLDKLVLARFGSMTTENQRVLRTASIIGMNFSSDALQGVLPTHLKSRQDECLQMLLHQKWLYQDRDLAHLYQFAHPHAHQIIYELTPSSERSNLHQLIADYIEEKYPNDRAQYGLLSYHYQHCDTDKALQYAVKATAVMLETEDIFDFGDLLDLLTGLFEGCCHTIHDVEVLQALVNQAKLVIEEFEVNKRKEQAHTWRASLCAVMCEFRFCAPHSTYAVTPIKSTNHTVESATIIISSTAALNFNLNDVRDEDEIREMNNEKEGSDINYEARTKRLLLLQIKVFRNQLSRKYVDLCEDGGVSVAPKNWQKAFLHRGQSKNHLHTVS